MIKKFQNIYSYAVLNFFDKFFIFATPLIILKFFNDKNLYNSIEYIYSIAIIFVIFFDLGLKNYTFFYLKKSKNYKKDLEKINEVFYFFIFYVLVFFGFILFFLYFYFFENLEILYFYILIRIFYLSIINFYKIFYRANDYPSKIFIFSIPVSLITLFLIFINNIYFNFNYLLIFFITQLFFLFFYVILQFNLKKITKNLNSKIILLSNSLKFTLPLMISIMVYNSMMSYGKIYSFNFLEINQMTFISFAQRLFLILTFFHATYISYFQKKIYLANDKYLNKIIFFNYFTIIIIINLCLIFGSNYIFKFFDLNFYDLNIILLLSSHSLLWCFSAYFETYLTKTNNNKFIMKSTIFAMIVFIISLAISKNDFLYNFFISLNISIFVHMILILFKINKVGIKLT